jgi:cytochrome c oxidase cbb3-type subunit 3
MRINNNRFKFLSLIPGITIPLLTQAQDSSIAPKASANSTVAIVMIAVAIVLAFVIWGMGQVLIAFSKQLLIKNKESKSNTSAVVLIACLLLSSNSHAQTAAVASTEMVKSTTDYLGMNGTGFWILATVILIEIIAIFFILFFINRIQQELLPQAAVRNQALSAWWSKMDKRLFTKAVAVEKEADIMLDHDYDGIRELDNALPPWWKYGFYFTILVGFIYLLNFHVFGSGKNPTEEYEYEVAKAKIVQENYNAKNADKIDEKNIQMAAAGGIEVGKEIFASVCWTCHGKLGEGGTGPNLTDNYWIHQGSLNDIYKSIKIGYPEKGMQAWEKNYSPKEISNIASYIKSLHGTNPPNAKAPQGDLFTETAKTNNDSIKTALPDSNLLSVSNESTRKGK